MSLRSRSHRNGLAHEVSPEVNENLQHGEHRDADANYHERRLQQRAVVNLDGGGFFFAEAGGNGSEAVDLIIDSILQGVQSRVDDGSELRVTVGFFDQTVQFLSYLGDIRRRRR